MSGKKRKNWKRKCSLKSARRIALYLYLENKMNNCKSKTAGSKSRALIVVTLASTIFWFNSSLNAQSDIDRRWDFSVGVGVTPPIADLRSRLNTGWHIAAGAGYNFNRTFGVRVEYMYNGFGVKQSVLNALSVPNGDAHMNSITLDPVFHFKTMGRFGGYLIGGGGFYRRTVQFTQPTTAIVDVFDPWWGYLGPAIIPVNRVIGSATSNAGGVNAGLGLDIDLGHGGAQFYSELRYHYAATHRSRTQLLPITFGVRW
jgi:hypothetical protein